MSEAPERIGLISDGFGNWALAHRDEVDTAVHYIRADLAPSPAPDVREAVLGLLTALNSTEGRARQAEAERDAAIAALSEEGRTRGEAEAERDAMREALKEVVSEYDNPDNGRTLRWAIDEARAALNREAGT